MAPPVARGQASHCIKCGREFKSADRINFAYIYVKADRDPQNPMHMMAQLMAGEFEFFHIECQDPQLDQGSQGSHIILPRAPR